MRDGLIDRALLWLSRLIIFIDTFALKLVHMRSADFVPPADPRKDVAEGPEEMAVTLREIDLGDFQIECPQCGERDHAILVGLALNQDQESEEGDLFPLTAMGMVAYPCGDILYSPCLTDKVARILNASDTHTLRFEMVKDLARCDVHGVSHNEE